MSSRAIPRFGRVRESLDYNWMSEDVYYWPERDIVFTISYDWYSNCYAAFGLTNDGFFDIGHETFEVFKRLLGWKKIGIVG